MLDGIGFTRSDYKTVKIVVKMSLKKLPDLWQLFCYKVGASLQLGFELFTVAKFYKEVTLYANDLVAKFLINLLITQKRTWWDLIV